jgi:murein DD-endopeptidase MepM/ murein hydrolase activator NlpD
MCNVKMMGQIDGHNGFDWLMPPDTPLFAVADGQVMLSGIEPPLNCPPLGKTVQGLFAQIRHRAPNGEEYASLYGHLDRVDVHPGDTVGAGSVIGLSGNTGCSTAPHLHLSIFKVMPNGQFVLIDPYGWHSPVRDPWAADPRGTDSVWLWKDGQVPPLR